MASGSNGDKVEIGALSLQDIKLWSTNAVKVFLRVRHKSTEGDFDELAAR